MSYTNIDNQILDNEELNIQEQSLLIALISYYNKEKGYAYPSYKQLMQRSKIKKDDTLIRIIKSLIDKGYVKKETLKGIGCKYYLFKCDITPTPTIGLPHEQGYPIKEVTPTPEKGEHLPHKRGTTNTNTNTNNIYSHSENDKTEEKYLEIFNHWNKEHEEKGIAKAVKLTADIKKGIDNALKLKKEDDTKMTIEDIKQSISNYAEVYNLQLFTYQWRLVDFLKRKQRDTGIQQLLLFLNNGTTYVNCKAGLNKKNKQCNNNQNINDGWNGYKKFK